MSLSNEVQTFRSLRFLLEALGTSFREKVTPLYTILNAVNTFAVLSSPDTHRLFGTFLSSHIPLLQDHLTNNLTLS